jgi:hypothetical protein
MNSTIVRAITCAPNYWILLRNKRQSRQENRHGRKHHGIHFAYIGRCCSACRQFSLGASWERSCYTISRSSTEASAQKKSQDIMLGSTVLLHVSVCKARWLFMLPLLETNMTNIGQFSLQFYTFGIVWISPSDPSCPGRSCKEDQDPLRPLYFSTIFRPY